MTTLSRDWPTLANVGGAHSSLQSYLLGEVASRPCPRRQSPWAFSWFLAGGMKCRPGGLLMSVHEGDPVRTMRSAATRRGKKRPATCSKQPTDNSVRPTSHQLRLLGRHSVASNYNSGHVIRHNRVTTALPQAFATVFFSICKQALAVSLQGIKLICSNLAKGLLNIYPF